MRDRIIRETFRAPYCRTIPLISFPLFRCFGRVVIKRGVARSGTKSQGRKSQEFTAARIAKGVV